MRLSFLLCAAWIVSGLFVEPVMGQGTSSTTSTVAVNGNVRMSSPAGDPSAPTLHRVQPVIGQPYSLLETMTWEHIRPGGTRSTTTSQRHMMRDAEGRTRTEAGALGSGLVPRTIVVDDPVQFTLTVINEANRTATVSIYNRTPSPTTEEEEQRNERLAKARFRGASAPVVEKLPATIIEGVAAEGKRETRTIPAGCMGNNSGNDTQVVTETWTSPELKIVLRSSTDNPVTGKWTREVTELKREAPDPSLFQVPEGYRVTERQRRSAPVQDSTSNLTAGLTTGVAGTSGSTQGLQAPQPCMTSSR